MTPTTTPTAASAGEPPPARELPPTTSVERLRDATRFRCTPGGAIAAGRRRMRRLLVGIALSMLALGVVVLLGGRWGPALLCGGAAFLCVFAWRMSGDLDPLWITLEGGALTVQMRRQRASLPLRNVVARRLTAAEAEHLASLTSADGVTFSSASYESRILGSFDLYASELEHAVMVEADAPPDEAGAGVHGAASSVGAGVPRDEDRVRWIVTPDDPEAFLLALGGPS